MRCQGLLGNLPLAVSGAVGVCLLLPSVSGHELVPGQIPWLFLSSEKALGVWSWACLNNGQAQRGKGGAPNC